MDRTVLIADDDNLDRRMAANIVQTRYDIIEVSEGEEALSVLEKSHSSIAAVILDIMMPVMGGFDTLRKIRSIKTYLDIPVIMI